MKKEVKGTKEWASGSVNCANGCSNDCFYCYAKEMAIRFKRKTPETWKQEECKEFPVGEMVKKHKGMIMFPTTHDITKSNIGYCQDTLTKLLLAGNKVLVVSKPDPDVIEQLCNYIERLDLNSRKSILFRFTIGSMDNRVLRLWEPSAPSFEERLYALMWCFKHKWQTSVSMEPCLEKDHRLIVRQVEILSPYVTDAVWIGKMNHPRKRVSINCGGNIPFDIEYAMAELVGSQSDGMIMGLYKLLKDNSVVKWKESIKKVVGLEIPTEVGLDI
jgi:DNA repair photolyase